MSHPMLSCCANAIKGSNMIVCVLLVSNSRGCCLAGRLRGHSPSDRPAARQHPREFDTNNTHTIMFDPDYNMTPPFFSTAANILLIKSNSKFESKATAVSVAMSPYYLGGKYRSRLHPRLPKYVCKFLRETERVKSNITRLASSASRGDNKVDHAVCLKAEFQMHTALSNENDKLFTTMIYPYFSRSVCFSMGPAWWRFGLCSSGSSLVSWWRDALLMHAQILNVTSQM